MSETMTSSAGRVTDIERINVMILIIGSIATIFIMREFKYVFSFAIASAIMTVNFRLLKKIIEATFLKSGNKKQLIKLPLKFLGLAGLVAVVVLWGDVDILFFLIGLSTVFLSVIISQILLLFSSEARRKENGA